MKGFMHIVEIIIVLLAMFVIVVQFVNTPGIDTDWSGVSLSTKVNDMLHSLEAAGIDWFNGDEVSAAINSTLNMSNIVYSVKLRNVIKPGIRVGCVCFNDGEYGQVSGTLQNPAFSINGQDPGFTVENITTDDLPFDYDVIVVMDRNISYTNAYKYLADGGGLVEVRDLNLQLAGPGENFGDMGYVHQRLFGIAFSSSMPSPSEAEIAFNAQAGYPNSTYYNIYKYFYHIPNGTGMKINESHMFADFLESDEQIEIVLPSARALLNQTSAGSPALIANKAAASDRGRTAWLSGGASLANDDMSVLLKSLVIWASGEEYDVAPGFTMSGPVKATMYKVYNTDMMQPVEIELMMGSIY